MNSVFKPRSIAVIGASREPGKIGNVLVKNLVEGGYRGPVYPVNPSADEVLSLPCYASVLDVPGNVDCAVIATPAAVVEKVLAECGRKHVSAAIVISAGFGETGDSGAEARLAAIARRYGIAMVGPNCLGVVNPDINMDLLFLPTYKMGRPKSGGIAFVTQSGAIGSMILDLVAREGFGVSKFVSYGNAATLDETDFLEYLMRDPETKMVVLYIEGVKRGRAFFDLTRRLAKKKPLVVLKAGVTERGAAAAKSHTGALAGSYAAYRAVFRQNRIVEARTVDEVFDYAKIFTTQPRCTGGRVAVVTNGGGMGVLLSDALAQSGLSAAEFSPETRRAMKKALPPLVAVQNPLDLLGDADAGRYEAALSLAYDDPGVDAIIAATLFQTVSLDSRVVDVIVRHAAKGKKPLVNVSLGGEYTEVQRRALESSGIPSYGSPTAAANALARLVEYSRFTARPKR